MAWLCGGLVTTSGVGSLCLALAATPPDEAPQRPRKVDRVARVSIDRLDAGNLDAGIDEVHTYDLESALHETSDVNAATDLELIGLFDKPRSSAKRPSFLSRLRGEPVMPPDPFSESDEMPEAEGEAIDMEEPSTAPGQRRGVARSRRETLPAEGAPTRKERRGKLNSSTKAASDPTGKVSAAKSNSDRNGIETDPSYDESEDASALPASKAGAPRSNRFSGPLATRRRLLEQLEKTETPKPGRARSAASEGPQEPESAPPAEDPLDKMTEESTESTEVPRSRIPAALRSNSVRSAPTRSRPTRQKSTTQPDESETQLKRPISDRSQAASGSDANAESESEAELRSLFEDEAEPQPQVKKVERVAKASHASTTENPASTALTVKKKQPNKNSPSDTEVAVNDTDANRENKSSASTDRTDEAKAEPTRPSNIQPAMSTAPSKRTATDSVESLMLRAELAKRQGRLTNARALEHAANTIERQRNQQAEDQSSLGTETAVFDNDAEVKVKEDGVEDAVEDALVGSVEEAVAESTSHQHALAQDRSEFDSSLSAVQSTTPEDDILGETVTRERAPRTSKALATTKPKSPAVGRAKLDAQPEQIPTPQIRPFKRAMTAKAPERALPAVTLRSSASVPVTFSGEPITPLDAVTPLDRQPQVAAAMKSKDAPVETERPEEPEIVAIDTSGRPGTTLKLETKRSSVGSSAVASGRTKVLPAKPQLEPESNVIRTASTTATANLDQGPEAPSVQAIATAVEATEVETTPASTTAIETTAVGTTATESRTSHQSTGTHTAERAIVENREIVTRTPAIKPLAKLEVETAPEAAPSTKMSAAAPTIATVEQRKTRSEPEVLANRNLELDGPEGWSAFRNRTVISTIRTTEPRPDQQRLASATRRTSSHRDVPKRIGTEHSTSVAMVSTYSGGLEGIEEDANEGENETLLVIHGNSDFPSTVNDAHYNEEARFREPARIDHSELEAKLQRVNDHDASRPSWLLASILTLVAAALTVVLTRATMRRE